MYILLQTTVIRVLSTLRLRSTYFFMCPDNCRKLHENFVKHIIVTD